MKLGKKNSVKVLGIVALMAVMFGVFCANQAEAGGKNDVPQPFNPAVFS